LRSGAGKMSDEEEKARELGSFVRRQSQQSLRNIDQDEIQVLALYFDLVMCSLAREDSK